MPRTFAEMFEKQLGYQYLLDEGRELGEQEKVERIGRLALLQHGETHEQMDELGYRIHKRYKRPEWDNAMHEWIDQFKFLLAQVCYLGIDPEEIAEAFFAKSEIVERRLIEERSADSDIPIAVFDIDGVLCEFSPFTNEEEAVLGGVFRLQEPIREAVSFLDTVRGWGIRVVLVTARKNERWQRITVDTEQWLAKYDVGFDELIFAGNKANAMDGRNVVFAVEDNYKHALGFAEDGIKTFLVKSGDSYLGEMPVSGVGAHADIVICETPGDMIQNVARYVRELGL